MTVPGPGDGDLLDFVSKLAALAAETEEIESAIQRAADLAQEHFDLVAASVWLVDPARPKYLELRALSTRTPMASPPAWSIPAARGVVGRALRQERPQLLVDVHSDSDYLAQFPETIAEVVIPLRHRDGALGAVVFDADRPEALSSEKVALLEAVASQLAGLARFAAIERRNQEMTFELEQSNLRLRERNESLSEFATTDALTGLPNRRQFDQTLETEWRRATRGEAPIAIILGDIDYFKRLNDTAGHQRGDVVLAEVAEVLRGAFTRAGDLAARYGGEEFVVVLPDTPLETAAELAEQARARIEARAIEHPASQLGPVVTLSMGVASVVPGLGGDPALLLAEADAALYRAKARGRNRVELAGGELQPGSKLPGFKTQVARPET
ncbi:MAG: sensor domain-containing diguanylate cyclase [Thermoanaerobaculia bacterium]|nr:MAG: sensor domain-containing diguanylate cyclase [Thermoanaerobaculia bacterium]MBZ0103425.1 sensor domain-containing diguanylate cyclase [Thermoanaerobaculia bacterium]